jgi:hypothetical protein
MTSKKYWEELIVLFDKLLLVLGSTFILCFGPGETHSPYFPVSPGRTNPLLSSQSHSYFTTGGLQPISSSWRQAP